MLRSLIALAAVGLAGIVAFELRPQATVLEPASRPVTTGVVAPAAEPGAGEADRATVLETLLARPLFSQTRRPPDMANPAAAAEPATPLPRMTAILIDGPRRSAIFAPPGDKPISVAEGGRIGPFTVETIEPRQVVVLGPEGRRVVRTSFDPNGTAPALGAAPNLPQFPGIVLQNVGPAPGQAGRPLPMGLPAFPPAAPAGYGSAR